MSSKECIACAKKLTESFVQSRHPAFICECGFPLDEDMVRKIIGDLSDREKVLIGLDLLFEELSSNNNSFSIIKTSTEAESIYIHNLTF